MKLEDLNVLDLYSDPRKDLGDKVPLFFYRLLNLVAVGELLGHKAPAALYESGKKCGLQVAQALSMRSLRDVEQFFLENGVGILTIDPQADGTIHATMAECAGCFGMPRMEVSLCEFECGLVTGFLEGIAGGGPGLTGEEIQCMSLGDFMCKFEIRQSR